MSVGYYGDTAMKKIPGGGVGGRYDVPEGVDIRGRYDEEFAKILTKDALIFVAALQREFRNHVKYAMECRKEAKMRYNSGGLPGFDPATKNVRDGDWMCAEVPPAVADRRVEITGPVERKMIINALNSGAKVFMVSDFCFMHFVFSIVYLFATLHDHPTVIITRDQNNTDLRINEIVISCYC